MRNIFIETLTKLAEKDERIILLTGDLGYKIFDDFKEKYPDRFYNVGIAEQNMVGMASGLAMEGFKPFLYSIVPFITSRCHEQIRNDLAYHNRNVTLVGFGGGFTYGHNGPTHHGIEDISLFRSMPNMNIFCPGDTKETKLLTEWIVNNSIGPSYLRLSAVQGFEYKKDGYFGNQVVIFTTGNMLKIGKEVQENLLKRQIDCGLFSVPCVKPFNFNFDLIDCPIVTLEEHNIYGGLGSAVAEILAQSNKKIKLKIIGIEDKFTSISGDQDYLRKINKLDPVSIEHRILKFIGFYNEQSKK